MFGVKKEQLVKALCRVSCQLCGYLGTFCDCKYMNVDNEEYRQDSEQTGCCESAMAATLINAMTPEEFYAIAERAGIQITLSPGDTIEVYDVLKNMKKQRNSVLYAAPEGDNDEQ